MGDKPDRSSSVIIYRTGQLGDTLVGLPAMRAIRHAYPNHELILLTDRQFGKGFVSSWEVLKTTKLFSRVLYYTPRSRGLRGLFSPLILAYRILQCRPEALFCLRDSNWQHAVRDRFFFQTLCGIDKCYGTAEETYQTFGRRDPSGKLIRYPSEADFLLNIVRQAGTIVPKEAPTELGLPISSRDSSRIDSVWNENSISGDTLLVGIGPGSKMQAKRWPLERFIEAGRWILENTLESRLVVLGGSEDWALGERIESALGKKVLNLAGKLTILESAEVLRRCDVYLGNDTGTMHLAAAAGIPCVVIFSARDHPGRWDPYGANHTILRTDPPCAGCLLEICTEYDLRCLKEISTETVIEAVRQTLAVHLTPA